MNGEPAWRHTSRIDCGRQIIVLAGEIDLTGAEQLHHLLCTAISRTPAVEVDMAAVSFIDSSGVGTLITAHNTATVAGRRIWVSNTDGHVRRVLTTAGVLDTLTDRQL